MWGNPKGCTPDAYGPIYIQAGSESGEDVCDSESDGEGEVFQTHVAQDAEGADDGNDDEGDEEEEISHSLAVDRDLDAFLEEWDTLDTKARKVKLAGSVLFSIDLELLGMDDKKCTVAQLSCVAYEASTGTVRACTLYMYPVGTS